MKFFLCLLAVIVAVNAGVLSGDRSRRSGSQTILVRQASTQDNLVIEEEPAPEGQAVQTIVIQAGPEASGVSQQKGQTIRILQSEDGSSGSARSSQSSSSGQSVQIIGGGNSSEDEELIKLILKADARS